MHKIFTYLLLGSLAVLGACASTREMDPDGQTHWMTRCDEDSDCGELSCICGVCTELCTASDECSIDDDVEASCERSDRVLDTTSCSLAQAAARVCVPQCDGQSDCSVVASDLACTSTGVCAIEDLPINEDDGSVDDEPDASDNDSSVEEEDPPITGPITPIELACDEEGNLDGTGPFEILVSGKIGDLLAIAPDGTVFATGTIDTVRNSAFRVVDGEIDPFGMELWELQRMVIEGSDLITVRSDGSEATVVATDLETEERLTLARAQARNVYGVAADGEAVYWIAERDPGPGYQVWRSPRVPGESVLLAEVTSSYDHVVVLSDDIFFFGSMAGSYELFRVAKDGDSALEALEVPRTAYDLRSDGEDLFFSLLTELDDLGNPVPSDHGIVRMDAVTHETETLFDTGDDTAENVTLGGPYLYWTTDHTVEDFKPIIKLWRGLKDGRGEPQQLGTLEAYAQPFAEHDGALYWTSTCRIGTDGTTKSHIVRRTD